MGWKSSLVIHLGFWFYLLVGGLVFYYLENPTYHLSSLPNKPITINDTFCQHLVHSVGNYVRTRDSVQQEDSLVWLAAVQESCNNLTFLNKTDEYANGDNPWEFSSALFLCMTILTTVGYGNFSPKSSGGKIFCMFYGLIGIPICGVFLASTSDYFSNSFLHLYDRQQQKFQKEKRFDILHCSDLIFPCWTCGLPLHSRSDFRFHRGLILFCFKDWSFLDATYFSFVTLTTIGFGDIVAAQETNLPLLWFYRICWIIWVTLGIAYWAIIVTFITKALKSKELRQKWEETSDTLAAQAMEMQKIVEHQLSNNGQHGNAFIALKSKAVFDFALQLTGSMGNVKDEVECQPLPGIATAFKPGLGRGIFALMELSVKRLGQHQQPVNQSTPNFVGDQVDNSPQTNEAIRPTLINAKSSSMDSGFNDSDVMDSINDMSPNPSRELSKTSSRRSLPCAPEPKANGKKESKWKLLSRSQIQPELQNRNSIEGPLLGDLLMEAILIFNEAEKRGTNLRRT
ncbi:potassium channel subfamily K member 2 isoform X2 [Daphnia magna]|uniref:potassium channel subfamily K member 2 isoform X2 n=1 Tax=Daphnia magna TaxID=35525 RepID=UPI001E1BD107|nr:potassium channel subfamily K member 2 isoform X2 [Daphnia magna]